MASSSATEGSRWRERVLDRSLQSARAQALSRSNRFLAVATELLRETGRTDFTVQEVVERSNMSLRSFYQHFAGKDDLLLALFEESIREYIGRLRRQIEQFSDPMDRLRAYVLGMYETATEVTANDAFPRALANYHLRLAVHQPPELAAALEPQRRLLYEIICEGVDSGQFRQDVPPEQLCMILLQTLIAALHMKVLRTHVTGFEIGPESLWAFCAAGVSPPAPTELLSAAQATLSWIQPSQG